MQDNYSTVPVPSLPPLVWQAGSNAFHYPIREAVETGPAVPAGRFQYCLFELQAKVWRLYNERVRNVAVLRLVLPISMDTIETIEI